MHEAGHALHYAGVDPRLPYTFRKISRDHALTEIYSYIFEAITREPGWHALHFGLSDAQAAENAQATLFLEALLFRRYTAKLQYELGFWSRFAEERRARPRLLVAADRRDRASVTTRATTSPTWTPASTRPTISARGSARHSCARTSIARDRRGLVAEPEDRRHPARPVRRGHEAVERGDRRRGSGSSRSTPARCRRSRRLVLARRFRALRCRKQGRRPSSSHKRRGLHTWESLAGSCSGSSAA